MNIVDMLLVLTFLHFVVGVVCTFGYELYLSEGLDYRFSYHEKIGLFFFGFGHVLLLMTLFCVYCFNILRSLSEKGR
jgi:hypothetical protein